MTTLPPGHKANLGTDLSDDHPISFTYDQSLATKDTKLRDPSTLPPAVRLDARQEMQCTTCHDAHDNRFGKFLVMDNANSQLCRSCHNQEMTEVVSHVECASCHQPHTAPSGPYLLRGATVADTCVRCHAGQPMTDGEQGANVAADLGKISTHNHPGSIDATRVISDQSDCNDCHGSHSMGMGSAVAPNIPPNLGSVSGMNTSGALIPRSQFEYEVCLKCHSGSTGSSIQSPSVTRQITQTDTRLEFAPTAISFHPVQAPGRSTDVPSLIPTLSTSSMIYCTDCHASDNSPSGGGVGAKGPHGSNISPLLSAPYERMDNIAESAVTYALCYKCHDRNSIIGNESFSGHSKHIVDNRTPCSVCHDPHGIPSGQGSATNHARLINFDTSVVLRDRITGRLEFQTTGDRAGTCYLTCHNVDHSPKSYPVTDGGTGVTLPPAGTVISPPSILQSR